MSGFSQEARNLMLDALRQVPARIALTINGGDGQPDAASGYAPIDLKPQNWTISNGVMTHPVVLFTFTMAVGLVTGAKLVGLDGTVLHSQTFEKPYDFTQFGGQMRIVPVFGLSVKLA